MDHGDAPAPSQRHLRRTSQPDSRIQRLLPFPSAPYPITLCSPAHTRPQYRLRLPGCASETSTDSPTHHSSHTPRSSAVPFCESYDIPTLLCTFGPVSALLTFSRVAPSSLAFVDGCHSTPPIRESGAAHDRTSRSHLISSNIDWTSSLAPLNIWCQFRRAERRAAMRSHLGGAGGAAGFLAEKISSFLLGSVTKGHEVAG